MPGTQSLKEKCMFILSSITSGLPADPTPLALVRACDGYYRTPKSRDGKRHGPLVGYAGRYDAGGEEKQYVGEVFVNFAKIERFPRIVREYVADPLVDKLRERGIKDLSQVQFCGAPMGGIVLSTVLADLCGSQSGYPDAVELAPATATSRAVKGLKYGRHEVEPGRTCVIVEDVCNNFSTTAKFIDEIHRHDGEVAGIVCFLDRSPHDGSNVFSHKGSDGRTTHYPVISLWREPMPEFRQDDEYVAADIAAGNVVWKPKDVWNTLPFAD